MLYMLQETQLDDAFSDSIFYLQSRCIKHERINHDAPVCLPIQEQDQPNPNALAMQNSEITSYSVASKVKSIVCEASCSSAVLSSPCSPVATSEVLGFFAHFSAIIRMMSFCGLPGFSLLTTAICSLTNTWYSLGFAPPLGTGLICLRMSLQVPHRWRDGSMLLECLLNSAPQATHAQTYL
jgi:hypothetical protein